MGEDHGDAVAITGLDDVVVPDGTAGLGDVGDAALLGALDVVPEGKEGVGGEGNAFGGGQPLFFRFPGKDGGLFRKDPLPCAVR